MRRNRVLALVIVGTALGLLRWIAPSPSERLAWLSLVALPLAYGHIIGAALFSRTIAPRRDQDAATRFLFTAFAISCVLTLSAAYASALRTPALQPLVLGAILLLSAWHTIENDCALGLAYRDGFRLGPLLQGARWIAISLALTAAFALAAASTREALVFTRVYFGELRIPSQSWVSLDELAAGVILYHTVSWWLFLEDRARALAARSPRDAARLRRRVLLLHTAPLACNAAFYFWLPAAHFYVAAPALYLFWSTLHVVHTAARRGFAWRAVPA